MERDENEIRFLNVLFAEVNGKIGVGINLESLSHKISLSLQNLLDIANSLTNEKLITLSPRVSGSDTRLISLTVKGKDFIIENSKSSNSKTGRIITIGNIGNNNKINLNQGEITFNSPNNPKIGLQNLFDLVDKIRMNRDSYPPDIQKEIDTKINRFANEVNQEKPNEDVLKTIGRELCGIIKPIASSTLSQFITANVKSFLGI